MKIAYSLIGGFYIAALLAASCGPDWGDCRACGLGSESTVSEAADGGTTFPPVVVIIIVTDDAGTPTVAPPDAGIPALMDAGCAPVCHKACINHSKHWQCSDGKTYNHDPKLCKVSCKKIDVCNKEMDECH